MMKQNVAQVIGVRSPRQPSKTHKAEPTVKEMKKGMEATMKQQTPGAVAAD